VAAVVLADLAGDEGTFLITGATWRFQHERTSQVLKS
jgi:hypothetical protein